MHDLQKLMILKIPLKQILAVNNVDQSITWIMRESTVCKSTKNDRSIHVQFGNQYTFLGAHANYQ